MIKADVKPTDHGTYTNFYSHTPDAYKKSVVKSLCFRAFKYCHSWEVLHTEFTRLKRVLVNNNYPLSLVEQVINNILQKSFAENHLEPDSTSRKYFIELQNLNRFINDTKSLKNIFSKHVLPTDTNVKINIQSFYRPRKIASFLAIDSGGPMERGWVWFMNSTVKRMAVRPPISATPETLSPLELANIGTILAVFIIIIILIIAPPSAANFVDNHFTVLQSFNNPVDLKIAEAIYIKQKNPFINVKYNDYLFNLGIFSDYSI